MIKIHTENGVVPLDVDIHIKHKNNGLKILDFNINIHHPLYHLLKNESELEYSDLYYLIKLNDDANNGTEAMVEAHLNVDDLKKVFFKHFLAETKTLYEILELALIDTGWTIQNAFIIEKRRTIDIENCLPIDVVNECLSVFEILYEFDNNKKVLTVIDPNTVMDKGFYINDQLNLTNINCTSDTYDFCTCMKCYGKTDEETGEESTFASINSGKDYIQNYDYSKKTIWGVFKDDRFENKESLLEASTKELKRRANPVTSYSLTIINLSKLQPNKYHLFNFRMHDIVTLKDDIRKKDVVERIIEYDEYPEHPENDVITLSDQPLSITDLEANIYDKVINIGNDMDRFQGNFLKDAKDVSTSIINQWAEKGQIYMTQNEIYILDKTPKELAKYVIRINLGGIAFSQNGWQGPYISAWTIDGKFNADFIYAGIIKGIKIIGNEISNGDGFFVDTNGNTTINRGTFKGDINTEKDINVGQNIYLDVGEEYANKAIRASSACAMAFNVDTSRGWRGMQMNTRKDNRNYAIVEASTTNTFATATLRTLNDGASSYVEAMKSNITLSSPGLALFGGTTVWGTFSVVNGTKNRAILTKNHGVRCMNAVESPIAIFEDNGNGIINEKGYCYIFFDAILLETVNTKYDYFVQLTKRGKGDIWCSEKGESYFIVEGTEGLEFDWNVKIRQKDFETVNLNQAFEIDENAHILEKRKKQEGCFDEELMYELKNQKKFEYEVSNYYENYLKEQEGLS